MTRKMATRTAAISSADMSNMPARISRRSNALIGKFVNND
jgi:hypothetical protein